jgi:hypothetical protein
MNRASRDMEIRGGTETTLLLTLKPFEKPADADWTLRIVVGSLVVAGVVGLVAGVVYFARKADSEASPAETVTTDRTPVGVGIKALGAHW